MEGETKEGEGEREREKEGEVRRNVSCALIKRRYL